MEHEVLFTEDPAFVLNRAEEFLASEPVRHNLILSLLHSRVVHAAPGRYWIALHGEKAGGGVVQSPLGYPATLTPMGPPAVIGMVDAIADASGTLPVLNGGAETAANFAGEWRC